MSGGMLESRAGNGVILHCVEHCELSTFPAPLLDPRSTPPVTWQPKTHEFLRNTSWWDDFTPRSLLAQTNAGCCQRAASSTPCGPKNGQEGRHMQFLPQSCPQAPFCPSPSYWLFLKCPGRSSQWDKPTWLAQIGLCCEGGDEFLGSSGYRWFPPGQEMKLVQVIAQKNLLRIHVS